MEYSSTQYSLNIHSRYETWESRLITSHAYHTSAAQCERNIWPKRSLYVNYAERASVRSAEGAFGVALARGRGDRAA